MTIEINENKIPLRFGYKALKKLSDLWSLNGSEQVAKHLEKALDSKNEFDRVDVLCELVIASAEAALGEGQTLLIDSDDVGDYFLSDPTRALEIMEAFSKSMPKGAPEPAGK